MRKPTLITFEGRTQTITAWARECGMNHQALRWRLQEGWSIERALTQASGKRKFVYKGRSHTISQWSRITGVSASAIRRRLWEGWSVQDALTTPVRPSSLSATNIMPANAKANQSASAVALCRQLRALSEALCVASCPSPLDPVRNDLRKRAEIIAADMPGVVKMFKHPLGTGGGSSALDCTKTDFSENRDS
jgi:hypothetical protein